MRLAQLRLPLRAAVPSNSASCGSLSRAPQPWLRQSGVACVVASNAAVNGVRYASVKAQGAYKLKNKKTLPKKMGAKRVGEQYVLPGTIIYKQRGTIWHPGANTILGRDHTIHAAVAGYVKYYRDPERHPKRQYIGVAFRRDDALPYPSQEPRQRRLGMVEVARRAAAAFEPMSRSGLPRRVIRRSEVIELTADDAAAAEALGAPETAASVVERANAAAVKAADAAASASADKPDGKKETRARRAARRWNAYVRIKRSNRVLILRKDYSYRESNFQIGRLMGKHRGKTAGTQRYGSRHSVLRHRRKKHDEKVREMKELMKQQEALMASNKGVVMATKKAKAPAPKKKKSKKKNKAAR